MSSAVVGALRVTLGLDTGAFSAGLEAATGRLRRAGRDLGMLGAKLSLGVTAPLTLMGSSILDTAGQFEAGMNRVAAATGAGAGEMAALEKAARDLGKSTKFSAVEAADAVEMLAKNGLAASDILGGALKASLDLAAASGSDLASAADLTTDVMLNFKKGSGDLGAVIDGVTGVLLASKFGFEDYRLALAQAGGVAGGLGVTLEDFNAVIAATSARFASGSDAGTSFKTFLQRLVPSSKAASEAMSELGLEFFDAQGSLKPMAAVAEELKRALEGLSDEAKSKALSTIFGTDAMRTAIGLMEAGAEGVAALDKVIREASAADQAAARMQGWTGEVEKLGGAFDELKLVIADAGLLDMATKFVTVLGDVADALSEADPVLVRFGVAAAAAAAALGPLLVAAGAVAVAIGVIGAPVALAIAGVAALSAAAAALWYNWDGVAEAVKGFGASVGADFHEMFAAMKSDVDSLWEAVKGFGASIGADFHEMFAAMKSDVILAGEAVAGFAVSLGEGIADGVRWAIAAFGELDAYLAGLRDRFIQIGRDLIDGLLAGMREKWESVKAWVGEVAQMLPDWFKAFWGIQSPSTVFAEIGRNVMDGLSQGLESGRVGVQSQMTSVADDLPGVFQQVGQAAAGQFSGLIDSLVEGSARGGDALRGLEEDLKRIVLNKAFSSVLGSLFGDAGYFPIPGFASGTRSAPGGLARINELGGEIVNLPRGAQVIPHDLSRRMVDAGASGGQARVEVNIHNAPAGTQVEERSGPGGTRQIDIFIRDRVRSMMGEGALDGAMRDNFGVGRRPRGA